ncbi:replication initiation protein, partial [Escherichia coli]
MRKCAQLELFRERLPRKPYYSDELTTGLRIADVARALGARYIQPNGPTHRHWIVFDVDHAAATLSWDDVGAREHKKYWGSVSYA